MPSFSTPEFRTSAMTFTTSPYGTERSARKYTWRSVRRATISRRAPPRRLNSMGCFPTKIRLLASTVMTSRSSSLRSAFALACGRFTSTPWVSMGAVTMKMIRRTSITSTSGVTLISAMTLRSPARREELILPPASPLFDLAFEEVDEFGGEAVDPGVDRPDPGQEIVVRHDRRDGRGQPRRGGDEGLGDAGSHGGPRGVSRGGDPGVRGDCSPFSACSYRAERLFPSAKALANPAWFRSIPFRSRNLRKMMAQETTENTTNSSRTSFTMGPGSLTCFSTWVSNTPAATGITGRANPPGTIKETSSWRSFFTILYNGFAAPIQSPGQY